VAGKQSNRFHKFDAGSEAWRAARSFPSLNERALHYAFALPLTTKLGFGTEVLRALLSMSGRDGDIMWRC
jgi:hypothetical protein